MSNKLIQQIISAEDLAKRFHYTYEALAPQFSYETRKASAKPWEEIPDNNRKLMIAVSEGILTFLCSCEGIAREKQPLENTVDMELFCPKCTQQHIDKADLENCEKCGHEKEQHYNANINISPDSVAGCDCCDYEDFKAWLNPPHKSHRCHSCNHVWKPFDYATNGVLATVSLRGLDEKHLS